MNVKYYVNESGQYIGCSSDPVPPTDGIEVPSFPTNALEEYWNGQAWEKRIPKEVALQKITVTTQSGKTFDGNETARSDMLVALTVGEWINETQTYWKMANNDTLLVTKEELQEALTLAIQAKGRIVGAIE